MFAALWSTVYSCIIVHDMKLCNKLKYHFNYIVFCFYVKPSQHHNSKLAWLYKWPRNFKGAIWFFESKPGNFNGSERSHDVFQTSLILFRKLSLRSKAYNQPKIPSQKVKKCWARYKPLC